MLTIDSLGTGFSDGTDQVSVKTGKTTCSVTEATATQIRCTVGNASAGNQDVSVHIAGKGKYLLNWVYYFLRARLNAFR